MDPEESELRELEARLSRLRPAPLSARQRRGLAGALASSGGQPPLPQARQALARRTTVTMAALSLLIAAGLLGAWFRGPHLSDEARQATAFTPLSEQSTGEDRLAGTAVPAGTAEAAEAALPAEEAGGANGEVPGESARTQDEPSVFADGALQEASPFAGDGARADASRGDPAPFMPFSSERFVSSREAGEWIRVEGVGLVRPVLVRVEDAVLWHDPVSATNVQVIQPSEALLFLPVETL